MLHAVFVVAAAALVALYFYLERKQSHWRKRGIPGPQGGFLFGSLFDVWFAPIPRAHVLRNWTQQYGKVYGFREGQRNILVVSDLEMTNEILNKQFDIFADRMAFPLHRSGLDPKTPVVNATGARWKRLRTMSSFGFTNAVLKKIRPTVEHSARMVIDHLEQQQQGEVDMLQMFQEFTIDIICKVALGKKDVVMFDNKYLAVCKEVFNSPSTNYIHSVAAAVPAINRPLIALLDFLGSRSKIGFMRLIEDLIATVKQRKAERESMDDSSSSDFIDIYLDAEVDTAADQIEGSRKMILPEVVSQCIIMLLAGFDTTANSLAYATYFLATNPEIQERMREEVERVCPGEGVEYEALAQLEYTNAVMKEALRHFPLASAIVGRECSRTTEIGGYALEKGDLIMTDTWTMHMDEQVWGEDAEEFRPERWLESSSDTPRYAFQSFGEGPRICVGKRLAVMEEKIMLVYLLKHFRIHATEQTSPLKLVGDVTVGPERVMVRLERV